MDKHIRPEIVKLAVHQVNIVDDHRLQLVPLLDHQLHRLRFFKEAFERIIQSLDLLIVDTLELAGAARPEAIVEDAHTLEHRVIEHLLVPLDQVVVQCRQHLLAI
eukprot:7378103-Prymnesium_polylepis.2